ncbi:hypothetical protein [Pseudoalteromonas sp. S16_S37]|uniref:hypothetical protein n=1 Tax=Pseudoalteromonas sp. S16_S37 TaxID=2720228 RepID=UPI0016816291|nr:hypothetical protein [Pseudoalteromonas sp. S16_S37]MBD1583314.1 hypothetical protein [Pseudoalteromonas sp. S16_S37]
MTVQTKIEWVGEDFCFVNKKFCLESLFLVSPKQRSTQSRWQSVIESQYALDIEPIVSDLVVICPLALEPLCRYFYDSAQIITYLDFTDVPKLVELGADSCFLVVGFANSFKTSAIANLTQLASLTATEIGFICGRDIAHISFLLLKNTLSIKKTVAGTAKLDAPLHRYQPSETDILETMQSLITETKFKILRSHGEGSHAKLPGVTVCGLLEDNEFEQSPRAGCSKQHHQCKRAQSEHISVVFADEVRAPIIVFFCCNGFNVSSELYPSPVSMALALSEAWCGALITSVRPVVVTDAMVTFVMDNLDRGASLGWIVTGLNRISAQLNQQNAFVLMGNPSYSYTVDGASHHTRIRIADTGCEFEQSKNWLSQVVKRSEYARRLLRTFKHWLGEELPEFAEQLDDKLARLSMLTSYLIKRAELGPSGEELKAYYRSFFPLKSLIRQWDRCLSENLLKLRQNLDPYDAFHYDQIVEKVVSKQKCPRCNSTMESLFFGRSEPDENKRTAQMCLVCGPVSEYRTHGLGIEIVEQTKIAFPGDVFTLTLKIQHQPRTEQLSGAVSINLRFFDKAMDLCVQDTAQHVTTDCEYVTFEFELPQTLSFDLHSIRILAVSGLDYAYCRARLVCVPREVEKEVVEEQQ